MNDKEKRIKELAKDIGIAFQLAGTTRFADVAEILVDKWQRKIPEDKVVLSKEEYQELKDRANIKCDIENIREAVFDATSCVIGYEAAEKIYQRCFPDNPERFVKEHKPSYNDGYFDGSKETAEVFVNLPNSEILTVVYDYEEIKVVKLEKLQEIATRFGVELGESRQ